MKARRGAGVPPGLIGIDWREGALGSPMAHRVGSWEAQAVGPDRGVRRVPNHVVGCPAAAMNHGQILPWIIHVVTNYLIC
jgi:hypothetical protein